MSKEDDEFKTIISASLEGGSMSMTFPLPEELQSFSLSHDNILLAIEYYLLARYAYLHDMNSTFMINSFWAVEHLTLSLLIFKVDDKEKLKEFGGYHSITSYWKEAKEMLPPKEKEAMCYFDDYIGKIQGYFSERYPTTSDKPKLKHTNKYPHVTPGNTTRFMQFGHVAQLNLDELDHFVNFMLHDITIYKNESSSNIMSLLAKQKNEQLYRQDNKFSITYPNKEYFGELSDPK